MPKFVIKLTAPLAGAKRSYAAGVDYTCPGDFDEQSGARLVDRGLATLVEGKAPKIRQVETATVEPKETAEAPSVARRRDNAKATQKADEAVDAAGTDEG